MSNTPTNNVPTATSGTPESMANGVAANVEPSGITMSSIIGTGLAAGAGMLIAHQTNKGDLMSTAIGGLIGAGAGTLLNGVFNAIGDKILGKPTYQQIQRNNIPAAHVDAVIKTPVTIEQPKEEPAVSSYLIRPNEQRFQSIMDQMQTDVSKLAIRRTRIEGMPISSAELKGAQAALRQDESNADQLIANGRLWQKEAERWNKEERPRIETALRTAKKALSHVDADTITVKPAPLHQFAIPTLKDSANSNVRTFHEYGRNQFAGEGHQVSEFDKQDALVQMRYTQIALDKRYNELRPGNPGGIDNTFLVPRGPFMNARPSISFLTNNSVARWAAEKAGGELISNTCEELIQHLSSPTPTNEQLSQIATRAADYKSWLLSRTPDDKEALGECTKIEEYIKVCTLRNSASEVQTAVYKELDQFQTVIKQEFKPHVERMNTLNAEIEALNKQIKKTKLPETEELKITPKPSPEKTSGISLPNMPVATLQSGQWLAAPFTPQMQAAPIHMAA